MLPKTNSLSAKFLIEINRNKNNEMLTSYLTQYHLISSIQKLWNYALTFPLWRLAQLTLNTHPLPQTYLSLVSSFHPRCLFLVFCPHLSHLNSHLTVKSLFFPPLSYFFQFIFNDLSICSPISDQLQNKNDLHKSEKKTENTLHQSIRFF